MQLPHEGRALLHLTFLARQRRQAARARFLGYAVMALELLVRGRLGAGCDEARGSWSAAKFCGLPVGSTRAEPKPPSRLLDVADALWFGLGLDILPFSHLCTYSLAAMSETTRRRSVQRESRGDVRGDSGTEYDVNGRLRLEARGTRRPGLMIQEWGEGCQVPNLVTPG